MPFGARKGTNYYVTPQLEHWPRYDVTGGRLVHVEDGNEDYYVIPTLLDLDAAELAPLALMDIYVDFKHVRGGRAPLSCPGKLSVVRCE